MKDRYLNTDECVKRLVNDYKKHNNLFIAFDYDNTVSDFHKIGDTFPKLETLLKECKEFGLSLILFTAKEEFGIDIAFQYCLKRGYKPDYINESPVMKTKKPYYNILLDDRAGLNEAYEILTLTLKQLKNE